MTTAGLLRLLPGRIAGGRVAAVSLGCSLAIFLAQGCVFAALGVVLEAMRSALGWNGEAAGGAFSVMVIACCVTAAWPARLIAWWGGKATMAVGMVVLAASFGLASVATTPLRLDSAMALTGAGFSLVANAPALYMMSGWAGDRTGHHVGFYLTAAGLGSALMPPLAEAVIAHGWAMWWRASAMAALVLAGLLLVLLRNPPDVSAKLDDPGASPERQRGLKVPWGRAYAMLVLAMVLSQTAMLTVSSVAPPQLARHGIPPFAIAAILGSLGLVGAIATAVSGWITRWATVPRLLSFALLSQGVGTLALLAVDHGASGSVMAAGFVLGYGFGMPMVTFAVTMLLVEWFGRDAGTAGLGFIWTAAGLGAVGPWAAGVSFDRFSGHGPALAATGAVLIAAAMGLRIGRDADCIK